jgi:predicted GIY-YIG superfamily endonuclease
MNLDGPAYVYRAFDAEGLLLYVGCTKNVATRLVQHRSQSTWTPYLDHYTSEFYPDRESALAAEAEAIRTERPFFNCQPEQTAMLQMNRVKAKQAVDRMLESFGIQYDRWDDRPEEWWTAWHAARTAVQHLIAPIYPMVLDADRHQAYQAAKRGAA